MTRNDAIDKLKCHRPEFEQLGVEHLYLFGSTACDEGRGTSDVDLFFDHRKGEIGLYEIMDVRDRATEILGRMADVTTRAGLHPRLRSEIEARAVRIF